MPSHIPALSRRLVKTRDKGRCVRCGCPTREGEWHHRRSRRVSGKHRHCACNGVWLCHTCHVAVHQNPEDARLYGFIVSQFVKDPGTIPVLTWYGVVTMDCQGFFTHFKSSDTEQEQPDEASN